MPVFVNAIVITGEVGASRPGPAVAAQGSARAAGPAPAGDRAGDRAALADEITAAVLARVEQALDRLTER